MIEKTFKELEQAGWTNRAAAWDNHFALVTNQAIDTILDQFGNLEGKRLLDVGCGTGQLSAAAAERGARAEGIDFADKMIAIATANYPEIKFSIGDAENLPYEDVFDCVVCSFGLLHMEQPEKAMAEACRVLRSGGRYTFTVWCSPEQGCELFALVLSAIQAHGAIDVGLPPAPPIFRFANADECHAALTAAGFLPPVTSVVPITWYGSTPRDVLDLFYKSAVRITMVLERQTPEARERIHEAIIESAERFRAGESLAIPSPAFLATAIKP